MTSAPDVRFDAERHVPFGYAPGKYQGRCARCEQTMTSCDKRAVRCLPCAEELAALQADPPRDPTDALDHIAEALRNIDRQVQITCQYDREETAAKRNSPVSTTVEASLSHVTDNTKRIRGHVHDVRRALDRARRDALERAAREIERAANEDTNDAAFRTAGQVYAELLHQFAARRT